MIKVIELFAGIGAQRQALKEAKIEHEVVAISEIDKYAISAYEKLHGLGYGGSVGALKSMGALEMGLKEEKLEPLVRMWRELPDKGYMPFVF